jgi:hypothetical protein
MRKQEINLKIIFEIKANLKIAQFLLYPLKENQIPNFIYDRMKQAKVLYCNTTFQDL